MKVRDLKIFLEGKDENLEVFIKQTSDEFEYAPLETAETGEIDFFLDNNGVDESAKETCLILTDEI